ncbi:uncharacterized protein LOC120528774 [Polypterus senegalus]|uniref:uncharacterized protein LOC120528774 n=1 Tax=Polypterus senegalus TaxID=55291 RepID=UPI001965115D|nr:uncharacterized protein LOC120528774 [Polypterus senegalus]
MLVQAFLLVQERMERCVSGQSNIYRRPLSSLARRIMSAIRFESTGRDIFLRKEQQTQMNMNQESPSEIGEKMLRDIKTRRTATPISLLDSASQEGLDSSESHKGLYNDKQCFVLRPGCKQVQEAADWITGKSDVCHPWENTSRANPFPLLNEKNNYYFETAYAGNIDVNCKQTSPCKIFHEKITSSAVDQTMPVLEGAEELKESQETKTVGTANRTSKNAKCIPSLKRKHSFMNRKTKKSYKGAPALSSGCMEQFINIPRNDHMNSFINVPKKHLPNSQYKIIDISDLDKHDCSYLLRNAKQAKGFAVTMVYHDGTSQLTTTQKDPTTLN